jgi:DNA-binding response OmpR family regulator
MRECIRGGAEEDALTTFSRAGRIVVCDDDEDIVDYLAFLLRMNDFEVRVASSYQEVMSLLDEYEPDLLLLDIRMPDFDGFNVAETLRQKEVRFPIIFMTAHDNKFCRLYSTTLGAASYLTKPFKDDDLLGVVRRIAAQNAMIAVGSPPSP